MTSGTGACSLTATWLADSNYSSATASQSTTASKIILTVTANNATRAYGLANPTFTASYSGFATGDNQGMLSGSPSLTTTAVATSVPGTYPIVAALGTLASANYSFSFVNGTLTVTFTSSVPTSSACNGAYNGTFNGNLTIASGKNCVFVGGGATGNVTQTGGNLVLSSATIGGNVAISGASTYSIGPSVNIKGNLQILNIPKGSATNQMCGSTVAGDLQYLSNGTSGLFGSGSPSCAGNVIKGNLQVISNTAATTINGNTVSGNVQVQNNTGAVTVVANTITANLQVQGNTGATTVNGNKVGGSLQDQNNIGATQVSTNVITSALQCSGNTSITGGGNTASSKQGQCAKF
jgi:hypothetical protein